jgi:predicted dehydrogenase
VLTTQTVGVTPPDPHEPIRLGVVGLGAMGVEMLGAAMPHPDFVVRLAADLSPRTVERRGADFPGVAFTTDPAEVIGSPDVDAVYIATPPVHHADLAVAALRSGKAVFCEKPLAISLADGRRMLAAAEETGRFAAAMRGRKPEHLADFATALRVQRTVESFHGPT